MARLTTLLFAMWLGVTVSTVVDLEKRIIGGHECRQDERQYHVKLISTDINGKQGRCGGSLISDRWILTAAHCYKPGRTLTAHIGVHNGTLQEVEITKTPQIFKRFFLKHDLMLLELPKAVEGIDPVQRPDCTDPPNIGAEVQVAGHGRTKVGPNNEKLPSSSTTLQCADMNIVDCQVLIPILQREHSFCYSAPLVDTCPGDSGGGVVYMGKIYGVHVRSGEKVCDSSAESMDLCHPPYLKWINETINDTIKQPTRSKCCFFG